MGGVRVSAPARRRHGGRRGLRTNTRQGAPRAGRSDRRRFPIPRGGSVGGDRSRRRDRVRMGGRPRGDRLVAAGRAGDGRDEGVRPVRLAERASRRGRARAPRPGAAEPVRPHARGRDGRTGRAVDRRGARGDDRARGVRGRGDVPRALRRSARSQRRLVPRAGVVLGVHRRAGHRHGDRRAGRRRGRPITARGALVRRPRRDRLRSPGRCARMGRGDRAAPPAGTAGGCRAARAPARTARAVRARVGRGRLHRRSDQPGMGALPISA